MKKNVCMIVYNDYPLDTRVRREAETLAASGGYKIRVLALKSDEKPRAYELNGVLVNESPKEKYCGKSIFRYILSYAFFLGWSFIACTRIFFQKQVDIVHVHNMPNFLVLSATMPRIFGKKIILDLHDTVPETFATKFSGASSFLFKLLCLEEHISCSFAQRLFCVNHVQCETLMKRGIPQKKVSIIMNVPDDRLINYSTSNGAFRAKDGAFKVIYHGTLSERLGIDLIIQATARLCKNLHDLEVYLWGRGDDVESFVGLARELKVEERIHFRKKQVPMNILLPELKKMDLGIIGNRMGMATELMLPVKMLEYVGLGIPVVAPRLKGISYYFSDEMVSYYEPENVDSMMEAILRLYKSETLREKQAEKAKTFLEKYGWHRNKMDLLNVYQQL
jgi:glycosyltransferase involved in cell wall biosynthesis